MTAREPNIPTARLSFLSSPETFKPQSVMPRAAPWGHGTELCSTISQYLHDIGSVSGIGPKPRAKPSTVPT